MKKAYLLGIGGAGMTALAGFLTKMGVSVTGYDDAESHNTVLLNQTGIPVDLTPQTQRLDETDCCIYSTAIPQSHPLLTYARDRIPTYSRGEMMGKLSEGFHQVVAVAGTHGKTTASGMLTHMMVTAGRTPSALLGGTLSTIDGNGVWGDDRLLICEACEYKECFLHLKRDMGVVLNIDNDHLECYGNMEGLVRAFTDFLAPCNTCLVNGDDPTCMQCCKGHPRVVTFGLADGCQYRGTDIKEQNGFYSFTLLCHEMPLSHIQLTVPGKHNIYNGIAAAAAAHLLGMDGRQIAQGLADYPGTKRRFEVIYQDRSLTVADDYAHHPTEIEAVLTAARRMGYDHITVVFQPFTYSRTKALKEDFIRVLSAADKVILPPIMAGREPFDPTVSSEDLAKKIPRSVLCEDLYHCAATVLANPVDGQLVLTLGCGNVYRCAQKIAEELFKKKGENQVF